MNKYNSYCYVCIFVLIVILSLCLIGEEKKPQGVNVINQPIKIIESKGINNAK